jgi:hypothetical protein
MIFFCLFDSSAMSMNSGGVLFDHMLPIALYPVISLKWRWVYCWLFLQVPVDLVIDHSVQVDVARTANALHTNMEMEFGRNKERFAFLKWGATAFKNMLVVPPGSGIVHQVGFVPLFIEVC